MSLQISLCESQAGILFALIQRLHWIRLDVNKSSLKSIPLSELCGPAAAIPISA